MEGLDVTSTETEEGIAKAIIKGEINFRRDPWPRVSDDAKNLVKGMLEPDASKRLTAEQVLGMYVPYAYMFVRPSFGFKT